MTTRFQRLYIGAIRSSHEVQESWLAAVRAFGGRGWRAWIIVSVGV